MANLGSCQPPWLPSHPSPLSSQLEALGFLLPRAFPSHSFPTAVHYLTSTHPFKLGLVSPSQGSLPRQALLPGAAPPSCSLILTYPSSLGWITGICPLLTILALHLTPVSCYQPSKYLLHYVFNVGPLTLRRCPPLTQGSPLCHPSTVPGHRLERQYLLVNE